jgi:hypothetical protein
MENELKTLVKEFFRILDIEEESDEGRLFHPTFITSCRVLDQVKLNKTLARMKEIANDNNI